MSTIIATINVNFTSNYVGCHRLFWKRTTSATYVGPIYATPPCLGAGNPCVITFYDTVDTESCTNVSYEGYVQACCELESSTSGRIAFTTIFTPSPTCTPLTVTCALTEVATVTPLIEGSGYDPMSPPSITFVGGLPSVIATATATVGTGDIDALALSNQPTGPDIPTTTYYGVSVNPIFPASGSATVDATSASDGDNITCPINGGCPYINSLTVISSSGWSIGDQFYIDPSAIGNIGTAIPFNVTTATVTDTDYGKIIGYVLTDPGADYSSVPTAVIDPPPGVGVNASANVEMAPCPDGWTVGDNCLSASYSAYPIQPELGQSFALCLSGGTVSSGSLPANYITSESTDCCTTCVKVQIQNLSGQSIDAAWIDCNILNNDPYTTYKDWKSITIADSTTETICGMIQNSLALSYSTGVTVTIVGNSDCNSPT